MSPQLQEDQFFLCKAGKPGPTGAVMEECGEQWYSGNPGSTARGFDGLVPMVEMFPLHAFQAIYVYFCDCAYMCACYVCASPHVCAHVQLHGEQTTISDAIFQVVFVGTRSLTKKVRLLTSEPPGPACPCLLRAVIVAVNH